jgi:hypothetical protein
MKTITLGHRLEVRATYCALVLVLLLNNWSATHAWAQSKAEPDTADGIDETVRRAIKYLLAKQRADGAFV